MSTKKITIEGKQYNLDVERAKSLGILAEEKKVFESFDVGDLFLVGTCPVVIINNGYQDHDSQERFGIVGLYHSLGFYSDFKEKGATREEVLSWLNTGLEKVFVKNINSDFGKILNEAVGTAS